MLVIRLQRLGRTNMAQYRIVVQDRRTHPSRGKIVAHIGSYDPNTKKTIIDADLAEKFMANGAQPSPRIVKLFKSNKIKMPKWVIQAKKAKSVTKNPDKLRKNRPKTEPVVATPAEEPKPASEPVEQAPEELVVESEVEVVSNPEVDVPTKPEEAEVTQTDTAEESKESTA